MQMYLLDANVLIDANRDYYPMGHVDEYWEWLLQNGKLFNLKIPYEIMREIRKGSDNIAKWASEKEKCKILTLEEEVPCNLLWGRVYPQYNTENKDISEEMFESIGADPFLIAYALIDPDNRTVVTCEASKPKTKGANRRVPDVCASLGVKWISPFNFIKKLNFKTKGSK